MQPCASSPPQPARILSRTFSSAPPSPAPRARPLGCAPRSPGPRAATQRPREAQRVYFRRHHDPQACEKPGSVRSPRPAPRDVLSLSTAFPAKPSRRSIGSSEDAPPSPHPCSHRWIAAWSGEERLGRREERLGRRNERLGWRNERLGRGEERLGWREQGQAAPSCLFPAHRGMHPSFQQFLLLYPEHRGCLCAIRLLRASTHRLKILKQRISAD